MPDPQLTATAIEVVTQCQKRLPRTLRDLAAQVAVHYESYADEETVSQGLEPDILGLFCGSPHGLGAQEQNPVPPQIILYVDSLWDCADGDTPTFREEVRLTYLHELGHFLGWDEDEVARHGLE
jgi:predicted Zn-dependent protease with MMP-like domain